MANRRMVHKSISYSKQVHQLNEFAQLLFTWVIPHLDDFGKIEGDAQVIKALAMPMSERPTQDFEDAIQHMITLGLVERYEVDGDLVLAYPKFEKYQQGLDKRTKSKYPDNPRDSKKFSEIPRSSLPTEPNITEKNLTELNKSETNGTESFADKNSSYKETDKDVRDESPTLGEPHTSDKTTYKRAFMERNPDTFVPETREEAAAVEIWKKLEPNNKMAFYSTYLKPIRKGLPPDLLYQFWSEIKDDPTIKNSGAVMNSKIVDYFAKRGIPYGEAVSK